MAKALDIPTFSIFSPQIIKEGWNGYEDKSLKHISVHIIDYKTELVTEISDKKSAELYQKFKPELFFKLLRDFCIKNSL